MVGFLDTLHLQSIYCLSDGSNNVCARLGCPSSFHRGHFSPIIDVFLRKFDDDKRIDSESNYKLATVGRNRPKEQIPKNRAKFTQSIYSSPPLETSLELSEHEIQKQQLLHNIYDATPDHSILKDGFAKSLSTFHLYDGDLPIEESSNQKMLYKQNNNVRKQSIPKHLSRRIDKNHNNQSENPHQSLPTLTVRSNSLIELSKKLAETTDILNESFSGSELSATESRQNLGLNLTGFEKTHDFGDFVTFSNSPARANQKNYQTSD